MASNLVASCYYWYSSSDALVTSSFLFLVVRGAPFVASDRSVRSDARNAPFVANIAPK